MAVLRKRVTLYLSRRQGRQGRWSHYIEKLALEVGEKGTNAALNWVQGESLYLFVMDITGDGYMNVENQGRVVESPAW